MSDTSPDKLPRREREILDALFAVEDGASTEEIRERLADAPSYSAVRAMLSRLESKGFVRHREDGPRYVYFPTVSRASARRGALDRLISVFFKGSPRETVTALLRQENWTESELDALQFEIERARQERTKTRRRS
jgi:predicted transcriptional regulator